MALRLTVKLVFVRVSCMIGSDGTHPSLVRIATGPRFLPCYDFSVLGCRRDVKDDVKMAWQHLYMEI